MGRCTITRVVAFALVSLACGGTAYADLLIGASFGYTHLTYADISDYSDNIVGIGSQQWGQPGLRVGHLAAGGGWGVNADLGIAHRSGPFTSDQTVVELMPQFQVNAREGNGPFANAGVGFLYEKGTYSYAGPVNVTRPVFGAGVGVQKSVSDGHGLMRVELRYDRVSEKEKKVGPVETFTFPATNMYSLKLGFDLILTR